MRESTGAYIPPNIPIVMQTDAGTALLLIGGGLDGIRSKPDVPNIVFRIKNCDITLFKSSLDKAMNLEI